VGLTRYVLVMATDWLVFGHLLGAFLFVGGSILASVLRIVAIRRSAPLPVAVLLGAARAAVPLVAAGFVIAVAFGFLLVERLRLDYGARWLTVTFALLVWLLVVGAVAGRSDRHTRELAERLVFEGGGHDELARRLRDPVNLLLNASMLVATVALIALMVFKP
jgi:hypothetical protein